MRTILRNFLNVLRRFKMASFLNIVGLSVAFTAFLVIMMQVQYERTFDRCYPTASRICRVDMNRGGRGYLCVSDSPGIGECRIYFVSAYRKLYFAEFIYWQALCHSR